MNNLISKIIFIYKIIFQTKYIFKKPKRANILIYDDESIEELNFYLKNKKYEIFHTRYEKIYIYIFLVSILRNGIKNLRQNYKINYFKMVSPKVVLTLIDENPGFFKLKNIYPSAKYISIQLGLKSKIFYNYIQNYKKKHKGYKFVSDISFVLGQNDKDRNAKYIESKFISLGSIKNNSFPIKENYKKKIKKILFISNSPVLKGKENNLSDKEKILYLDKIKRNVRHAKIFKHLEAYCEKKNIELHFLSKKTEDFLPMYKKIHGDGNWHFIPRTKTKNTYKRINEAQFVVFENSTLGYEALSKKIKGVCFPQEFPYKGSSKKYAKEGLFWSTSVEKKKIFAKIDKVINLNRYKWNSMVLKELKNILTYEPSNAKFSKTINRIMYR